MTNHEPGVMFILARDFHEMSYNSSSRLKSSLSAPVKGRLTGRGSSSSACDEPVNGMIKGADFSPTMSPAARSAGNSVPVVSSRLRLLVGTISAVEDLMSEANEICMGQGDSAWGTSSACPGAVDESQDSDSAAVHESKDGSESKSAVAGLVAGDRARGTSAAGPGASEDRLSAGSR